MIRSLTTIMLLMVFTMSMLNAEEDTREFVKFPEKLKLKLKSNMQDHFFALHEILEYIAYDDLEKAAEVAEKRLGLDARKAHKSGSLAKYMPQGMKEEGFNMHSAATNFSQVARAGDLESSLESLTEITSSCVACHASYKLK